MLATCRPHSTCPSNHLKYEGNQKAFERDDLIDLAKRSIYGSVQKQDPHAQLKFDMFENPRALPSVTLKELGEKVVVTDFSLDHWTA